jgi:hypothetical protein
LIELLEQALEQIDRMLGYESILQRTVAPLKFIQTLFKVESAGLSHSVQQMFLALTDDIDRLQQQVGQTFGEKFEMLKSARKTIAGVVVRLKASARTQHAAAREKKQTIERALVELQADLKRNEERDIRLTAVSRAIDQQVGGMVVSLQTQDIVSQKVAHVLQVLQEMGGRFTEFKDADDISVAAPAAAYCRDAGEVQSGQLQAVARDLTGTADTIGNAVSAISGQITSLNEDCLCLNEFNKVTAGVDGLVQVLLDTIVDVRTIVVAAVSGVEQSCLAIRPIGGLTSNVTETMRQLSAQIRLIALNAQVQAAHIGSGTGLEVLAAGTATIAVETTSISENVARELDTLTVHLGEHVRAFEELHHKGAVEQQTLDTKGQETEVGLHSFRDETLSTLSQVFEAVEGIRCMADSMGRKLDFRSVIDTRINTTRETLDRIVAAARQWLESSGPAAALTAPASNLAQIYTMASEREVHDAILLGRRSSDSTVGKSTGSGPEAGPELFTDFSEASVPPVEPSPGPERAGGIASVPCPVSEKPTSVPVSSVAKPLGDNVDLF